MRISQTWLRPILTAVLFPVVLIGIMWGVDSYAQWRSERYAGITRQEAVAMAWSGCFAKTPAGYPRPRWAYARLTDSGWLVMANITYLGWLTAQEPAAWAVIPTGKTRYIMDCRYIAPDW